jgi:hypothetical protein
MNKNKFFTKIVFSALLFSMESFGLQSQQSIPGGFPTDFIKDMSFVADKIANVTQKVLLVGAATSVSAIILLNIGTFLAQAARLKLGPYLPLYFSSFKQMEAELHLTRPEKRQNGLIYTTDDCFDDIVKIINRYDQVGPVYTGKPFPKYHRDREIQLLLLNEILKKYELFLPENITKQDWLNYSRQHDLNLNWFRQLTNRYENNQALKDATDIKNVLTISEPISIM